MPSAVSKARALSQPLAAGHHRPSGATLSAAPCAVTSWPSRPPAFHFTEKTEGPQPCCSLITVAQVPAIPRSLLPPR